MEKEKTNKTLIIKLPETLLLKFQSKCAENYKSMSEAVRDLIQEYIKK